ncbi:hypothetical protein QE152_g9540 [Popillia japonica]|uniref:Uncharacterized protein n=1 Tax=Popillia japonica TaxID=7064 RepID=A0AAW1LXS8_POPJA
MYFKLKDSVFNSVEVKLAFLNIFVGKSKEDIKIRKLSQNYTVEDVEPALKAIESEMSKKAVAKLYSRRC